MGTQALGSVTAAQLKQDQNAREDLRLDIKQRTEDCGANAYILRGGHLIPILLSQEQLSTALFDRVDPSSAMLSMLMTFKEIQLSTIVPRLPPGVVAYARPFESHFKAFVEAFVAFIELGTGQSCQRSAARRTLLLVDLHVMVYKVQSYFSLHGAEFSLDPEVVRGRALKDAETDIRNFFKQLSQAPQHSCTNTGRPRPKTGPVPTSGDPPSSA